MQLDILAIGAHPDDVEIGSAGTLLSHISKGYKAGVLDLTKGELGTRGTVPQRMKEARAAAAILGLSVRENLGFADGFFANDKAHQLEVIKLIRHYKPRIVLANAITDRHPDHARAAELVRDACFLSGLPKIATKYKGKKQQAFRPLAVYHYIQALNVKPDIVVDISPYMEKKLHAIRAYTSQFYNPASKEPATFISSPEFMEFIKARAVHFGVPAGVQYAEGFTTQRTIAVSDLLHLF